MAHEVITEARWGRARSFGVVALAYLLALTAAGGTAALLADHSGLQAAAAADVVGTLVVFAFSVALRNTSLYDAYWSVAPPALALFWVLHPEAADGLPARQLLVLVGVSVWAIRLTANWARGWHGLHQEDWRYTDFKRRMGLLYQPVNLFGLHLFPTVQVFLGCLAIHAVVDSAAPLGLLDGVAFALVLSASAIEHVADDQLHRFVASAPGPERVLDTGIWAWSRHPNYFGECLFWWGLWLFVPAADPARLWTVVGPLAITAMFGVVSIPLMEKRQLARRPAYAAYQASTPMLVPWPPSSGSKPAA